MHEKRGEQALRVFDLAGVRGVGNSRPHGGVKFTQAKHGACNAYILRELQGVMENGSAWAGVMHAFLVELYGQALPLQGEAAPRAQQRYRQILSQAEREEPLPEPKAGRGRPKSMPGRNLLRRMTEHEEAILPFALVEGVPFTSNQAERDLRPAKVKQKESGCFRTDHGAGGYARLQKVLNADVLEETGRFREGCGRPARLYRFRADAVAEIKTRCLFP